jgi:hypothetical protein
VIDLHMHTTASDGRATPAMLVDDLVAAGITTCAVTDHDTTASIDAVTALASPHGIRAIPASRSRRSPTTKTCTCSRI